MYCICLLVFIMVVVGGATRLTDSGLSITEWKPILGAIPPLNASDWQLAFEKYKKIPEYTQINADMDLAGFKVIYLWEWSHRFLGRLIGFAVLLPLVFFWVTGRLEKTLKPHLVVLFLLGAAQGAIGWWMVKSGLVDRVDVSQYRLAVHLTLAFVIFAWCLWIARGLAPHSNEYCTLTVQNFAPCVVLAILLQVFAGALVAGLDAGLAFNDWPQMDGAFVPSGLWIMEPFWRNLFENGKTVQFMHRMIAYSVLLLIIVQMVVTLRSASGKTHKRRTVVLAILVFIQASTGIVTLILQVPFSWAILHQAGAVVLLGFAIAHWRATVGSYPVQNQVRVIA